MPRWGSFLFISTDGWVLHNGLEAILRNGNLLVTLKSRSDSFFLSCNPVRPILKHCRGSCMLSWQLTIGGNTSTSQRERLWVPLQYSVQFSSTKCHYRHVPDTMTGTIFIPFKTRREVPVMAQWKLIWLVSMRTQVRSLALLSGLRIQHRCELWCRPQTWLKSGVAVAVA